MEWKVVLGIGALLVILLLVLIGPFIAGEFNHLGEALQPTTAQH